MPCEMSRMSVSEGLVDSLNFSDGPASPGTLEMIGESSALPPAMNGVCGCREPSLQEPAGGLERRLCYFYQTLPASCLVFFLLCFLLLKK